MDRQAPGHVQELVGSSSLRATPLDSRPGFFQRFRRGKKQDGAQPKAKEDLIFQKNDLTAEKGTLNERNIRVKPELQDQYATYLDNHLKQLAHVYNNDNYAPIFQAPEFRHQKMLLDTLAEKVEDQAGNVVSYTVSRENIEEALKNDPDLWITTTQIMEEEIALTLAGLGLSAQVNPGVFASEESAFDATVDPKRVHLNINRGKLNKLTGDHPVLASLAVLGAGAASTPQGLDVLHKAYAYLNQHVPQVDQFVQKAIALGNDPAALSTLGMQYGGAALAGLGLLVGRKSLYEHGVTIDLNRDAGLLSRLQSGRYTAEVQYLHDVIGLDVHNFSTNPVTGVTRAQGISGTKDIGDIQAALITQMWTRFKFYNEALGVPPEKITMISEDLTYAQMHGDWRVDKGIWGGDLQRLRHNKTAEFINRTGSDPNPEQQAMIDIEARREIITRRLEKKLAEQAPSEKTITKLKDQEEALAAGENKGRILENKAKGFQEAKALLSDSNTQIEAVSQDIQTYKEKLDAYKKALGEAQEAFETTSVEELNELLHKRNTVDDEALRSVKEALRTAEDELKRVEPQGVYLDSKIASAKTLLTRLTGIDAALGASAVGLGQAELATLPMDEIFARVNEAYRRSIAAGIAPPLGWNLNSNSDLALREQIMFMVAEARAAESEPAVGHPSPDYTAWTGAGVSENFLRSATVNSAIAELQRRHILPAAITPAHRTQVEGVLHEVQSAYNSRLQKVKEVLSQEPTQRKQYNNRMEDERAALDTLKTTIQPHNIELIALEGSLDQKRANPRQIAEEFLNHNSRDHQDAFRLLSDIHNAAHGHGKYADELDPANLHLKSMQDILDGIHAAQAAGVALAWDDTQDALPDHVRNVISGLSEAQAVQAIVNAGQDTDNRAMAELKGTIHLSESFIRTSGEDEVMKRCVANGWTDNAESRSYIKTAIDQAKQRFEIRRNILAGNLTDAIAQGRAGALPYTDADIAYLEKDRDYRNITVNIGRKLATIRTLHPALAGAVDSTAVNGFINTLDTQKRMLRDLDDMSGNIEAIQNQLNEYNTALSNYLSQREEARSKGNGAITVSELDTELKQRAQHPNTELETVIKKIKDTKAEIVQDAETTKKAKERIDNIAESLGSIRRMNADFLFATGRNAVGPADFTTGGIDHLMDRINFMYTESMRIGIRPPVGWPKEENTDTDHIETISNAVTAARAEAKVAGIVAAIPAALNPQFAATSGWFDEYTFLSLSPQELLQEAANRGHGLTQTEAEEILKIRKNIFDAISASTNESKTANDNRVKELDKQIKNSERGFESARNFVSVVRNMAENQGDIYIRIPGLIKEAVDPNFTVPIRVGNRFFTDAEKSPTINGTPVPNLPKGYYDILNMLTGYQDNTAEGRDVVFNKLINIPAFHPTALALQLNRNLGFRLGARGPITIDRVLDEVQRRVNNRTLNQSDLFHAIREMKEDYIREVKAIS